MEEITGEDVADMIAHWLKSTAGGRFGTTYGSDLTDDLMTPQYGGPIERSLKKLAEDVPVAGMGSVNAYTNPVGVDTMELFIESGGVMVNATEVRRGRPAAATPGVEVILSGSIATLQSDTSGAWTGAATATTVTVKRNGVDITAACTVDTADGPGLTCSVAGAVVSVASVEAAPTTVYTDVIVVGPFDGVITRRWTLTKDYSVTANPYGTAERFCLRFEGDLTDLRGHAFAADGAVTFEPDGAGGQVARIGGATTGDGGPAVIYGQSADFAIPGDFCLEASFLVRSNVSRARTVVALANGATILAHLWLEPGAAGTGGYMGASFRTSGGAEYRFSGPAYTLGTVRHVALVRKGTSVFFTVDGAQHGVMLSTTYRPAAGANVSAFLGNSARAWIDAMDGDLYWARLTDHYRYDPAGFPFAVPAQPAP